MILKKAVVDSAQSVFWKAGEHGLHEEYKQLLFIIISIY
jgi:hypothetical protein